MKPRYGLTCLCDLNCGVESVNRQTDTQTDRNIDDGQKSEN